MGYDEVRCFYPLPNLGVSDEIWQTHSLGCELRYYEIRDDGSLWHVWKDKNGDPLYDLAESLEFTGEIRLENEFSVYFVQGQLRELHKIYADSVLS